MALLVFRDGEPMLLGSHLAPGSMLMFTLSAFIEAIDCLDDIVGEVSGLAELAASAVSRNDPIMDDHFTELNISARETIRAAWVAVGSAEAAMQVALVALVVPSRECNPVRWNEDVAQWVAWVTRIMRSPILQC
jgi:hypothetical protein